MRMRLFPSFGNFAFGGNVTLSTSTHRHYDESRHRIEQLTPGNNTIVTLNNTSCLLQMSHIYPPLKEPYIYLSYLLSIHIILMNGDVLPLCAFIVSVKSFEQLVCDRVKTTVGQFHHE